jgi:hypothetical protein
MTWLVKPPSIAEHAIIELRHIIEVLQVEHASLFLRDGEHGRRPQCVAETGTPLADALPGHSTLIARALSTGRVQELEPATGGGAALAMPLDGEGEAIGALLVVSLRRSRRLGAADAQVIGRATEILVERIMPVARPRPQSDRFARVAQARPVRTRG